MKYQICKRCIVDSTVPGVTFDKNGICGHCKIHDKIEKLYPLGEKGDKKLKKIVEKIKKKGKNNKYDCIVGISGGRDSTFTLYNAKKLGLRPLAVFCDYGFAHPIAVENMKNVTTKLGIDFRIIKFDWEEVKDVTIACLKASIPETGLGADVPVHATLFGVAVQECVKYVISGHSFRTEGICPLEWNFMDGTYLKSIHKKFGTVKLKGWEPERPGNNFNIFHIFYYIFIKGIRTAPILNYIDYNKKEVGKFLEKEVGWEYPGSKYYDDISQSLLTYVLRAKFKIERRKVLHSTLIRYGQMTREEALKDIKKPDVVEDPKMIKLCLERLGISQEEFDRYMRESTKTFLDYHTSYNYIKIMRFPIKVLSMLNILPRMTYDKYFNC